MELPKLNKARSLHSMIYIPKKYIYIVGGGILETELYDLKEKSIKMKNKMNEIRNKCSLIVMNNSLLYAFCGTSLDGKFLNTVERCNLRSGKRIWSYVKYKTADYTIFGDCYYIGNYYSENKIILLAEQIDNKNPSLNILFDLTYENHAIMTFFNCEGIIDDIIPEKTFHPIGKNKSILIPQVSTIVKIYNMNKNFKLTIDYFPDCLKKIME